MEREKCPSFIHHNKKCSCGMVRCIGLVSCLKKYASLHKAYREVFWRYDEYLKSMDK